MNDLAYAAIVTASREARKAALYALARLALHCDCGACPIVADVALEAACALEGAKA